MILITGAAGFIASALIRGLNDAGENKLILVDRLGLDDRWKNIRGLKFKDYYHADDLFLKENKHIL